MIFGALKSSGLSSKEPRSDFRISSTNLSIRHTQSCEIFDSKKIGYFECLVYNLMFLLGVLSGLDLAGFSDDFDDFFGKRKFMFRSQTSVKIIKYAILISEIEQFKV